jgi:catechol 2,3-dioxygenase-like lactoylglutathione lyase family enzyme
MDRAWLETRLPGVFERVTLRTSDVPAAEAFYGTVLPGLERLWIVAGSPPTARLHLGFSAPSRADVDEFWRIGAAAGYPSDGEPGPRPQYGPDYYGAFLLDPDGNSAEAMHNRFERGRAEIDHLWIRVSDLGASRAFYEAVGSSAGFAPAWTHDDPPRVGFQGDGPGSFSIVLDGQPTTGARIAFAGARARDFALDPDGNEVGVVA